MKLSVKRICVSGDGKKFDALLPAFPHDAERLRKIKTGAILTAKVTEDRNPTLNNAVKMVLRTSLVIPITN